ncbi:hypothetical protein IWX50DRAFT_672460 [Phyllosticta citricarpa]|uniref:Delta(24)-sterol reductase n=1 Tax=Phyllosticta citricarpa TaxID=55181 RepID=A0ABR1M6B0_9PEZI
MEEHEQRAAAVAAKVADFHRRQETFRIYHGSTNSTRIVEFDPERMIDMSDFDHVLDVDAERHVAVVQANVPMDLLVEETLKKGLIPPVVMEFPGITVGGGYMGVAGESSSWKYGFFDRTVNWVDAILLTGEMRRASATQNADLLKGLPGTYGTVAVTTLFEIQLIPAAKYIELEYFRVEGMENGVKFIDEAIHRGDFEYLDGIFFSASGGLIMLGRLTDHPPDNFKPRQQFSGPFDPWFYVHAQEVFEASTPGNTMRNRIETVPIRDYLFRYDRGAFWTGRYAFRRFHTPFNRVTRALLDPLMHTRPMYAALNASRYTTQYVIQDVAVPFNHAHELALWNRDVTDTWPIWICPLRIDGDDAEAAAGAGPSSEPTLCSSDTTTLEPTWLLNFGIWGPGPRKHAEFVALNRRLEQEIALLGGFKWLYANAYYTEDEFWRIYDRQWYEAFREKYDAGEAWLPPCGWDVRAIFFCRHDYDLSLSSFFFVLLAGLFRYMPILAVIFEKKTPSRENTCAKSTASILPTASVNSSNSEVSNVE